MDEELYQKSYRNAILLSSFSFVGNTLDRMMLADIVKLSFVSIRSLKVIMFILNAIRCLRIHVL